MDGLELTIRALEFKKPERIPLYLLMTPWSSDVVGASYSTPRGFQPDKRFMTRGSVSAYIVEKFQKGKHYQMDEFGCIWYNVGDKTMGQVVKPYVLSSWDNLKDIKLPRKIDKGRWLGAKLLFGLFGKSRYCLGSFNNFFLERMHFLRGMDNILMDVKRNRQKVITLGEKLADWYCWLVDKWAGLGADGIIAADDWGTNHGTFISPRDFNEIFKPLYKEVAERIHDYNMHFWLHSCGNVYYLIPDLIEAGVDCLQFNSPAQTGLKKLREFGGKVCYCTVADSDRVLPYKTPKEVEARVLQMVKELGTFNGGLIGTNNIDMAALNIPKENMKANINAYKRFGRYDAYPLKNNAKENLTNLLED